MKYITMKCVNGNFAVNTETTDLNQAKVQYHNLAQTLWNAQDVATAKIAIMNEQLNVVEGYQEYIHHEAEETEAE